MILQALVRYYDRLVEDPAAGVAPYGYSPEKISYEILLAPDGSVVQVNDIRDTSGKKPSPKLLLVPQPQTRTVDVKSNYLWDKTSYVLGVSATSKRADREHQSFRTLHSTVLAGSQDEGLLALSSFLADWNPERFREDENFTQHGDELLDTNVVFRLDGERAFLHERPAAKALWADLLQPEDTGQTGAAKSLKLCLASGKTAQIARLHPAIKGVAGAQSSGARIVSFNLDAFTSFGKTQGENAPVSDAAAFAYTTVLNHLLRRGQHNRQRLQIADTSVVFWAEADNTEHAERAEQTFASLLDPPPDDDAEADKVRRILEGLSKGAALTDIDPQLEPGTRMYVLGLAPNASRLSVRFWQTGTLGTLAQRIAQHAADLRIEPIPWRVAPPAYRLVLATVPNREGSKAKVDDAFNNLIGEVMRAVLSGGLYPRSLLLNTVMRIRSDGNLSGLRAALCKGVLARERRLGIHTSKEDLPVSLDKQCTEPGYLMGRLFYLLENAQKQALGGINASIKDKYYGSASATPMLIYPMLMKNFQNHLSKLRKGEERKKNIAGAIERDVGAIINCFAGPFPKNLAMEQQGWFSIGYYHQSREHYIRSDDQDIPESEGEAA